MSVCVCKVCVCVYTVWVYVCIKCVKCVCVCREEFASHGVSKVVSLECRDVCSKGFGLSDMVDAGNYNTSLYNTSLYYNYNSTLQYTVFLDLPNPWLALPHAKEAMKVSVCLCVSVIYYTIASFRSVVADCVPSHRALSKCREQLNNSQYVVS